MNSKGPPVQLNAISIYLEQVCPLPNNSEKIVSGNLNKDYKYNHEWISNRIVFILNLKYNTLHTLFGPAYLGQLEQL